MIGRDGDIPVNLRSLAAWRHSGLRTRVLALCLSVSSLHLHSFDHPTNWAFFPSPCLWRIVARTHPSHRTEPQTLNECSFGAMSTLPPAHVDQSWPMSASSEVAQKLPTLVSESCQAVGPEAEHGPNSAKLGSFWAMFWKTSTEFGQCSTRSGRLGPKLTKVRPKLAKVGQVWATFWRSVAQAGQIWSELVGIWATRPTCGATGPNLLEH